MVKVVVYQRVTMEIKSTKCYQTTKCKQMEAMVFFVSKKLIRKQGQNQRTSYSPYLDQYKTDWQNQFQFTNVDLGTPNPHAKKTRYLFSEDFSEEVKR